MKHRGAEGTEKNTEKYFTKIELIGGFGYEGGMSLLRQLLEKSLPQHDVQLQNLQASELSTITTSLRFMLGTPTTGKYLELNCNES